MRAVCSSGKARLAGTLIFGLRAIAQDDMATNHFARRDQAFIEAVTLPLGGEEG